MAPLEHITSSIEIDTITESQRPPNLNPTCPGHGDMIRGGPSNGNSPGDSGGALRTGVTQPDVQYGRASSSTTTSLFDRPESINGQEGVEEEMVEVGDFGLVPRRIVLRAPSPDTPCRCQCSCPGCICYRFAHRRQYDNDDSPPSSLMAELNEIPASIYSGQRSFSSPDMSGILYGITGARETHRNHHRYGSSHLDQRSTVILMGEDTQNEYPLELSGSDFDLR